MSRVILWGVFIFMKLMQSRYWHLHLSSLGTSWAFPPHHMLCALPTPGKLVSWKQQEQHIALGRLAVCASHVWPISLLRSTNRQCTQPQGPSLVLLLPACLVFLGTKLLYLLECGMSFVLFALCALLSDPSLTHFLCSDGDWMVRAGLASHFDSFLQADVPGEPYPISAS